MLSNLRLLAPTSLLVLFLASPLTANTIDTFTASGRFQDGTTFSGTFSVDVTAGVVTAADLTYQGTDFKILNTAPSTPPGFDVTSLPNTSVPEIALLFVGTSNSNPLVGYAGGSACSLTNLCPVPGTTGDTLSGFFPASGGEVFLQSGTIAPTPEPSAFLLMSAGLMTAIYRKLYRTLNGRI